MNTPRGLGRGLGALIPTAPPPAPMPSVGSLDGRPADVLTGSAVPADASAAEAPATGGPDAGDPVAVHGAHFAEIPMDAISPNPRQPRQVFDEDAQAELVHSIAEVGLLQPVVVRPTAGGGAGQRYELVMGERRWRAAQAAGLPAIPAIVRDTGDDVMLRDALLENLHRSQLNPLEEAAAYHQLLDDFGCTHEELASRIGRSRPQITNTLRLLRLTPAVQRRVAAGVLTAGHARALVAVEDPAVQEHLAARTVAEQLSVRALEEVVATGGGASTADPTAAPVAVRSGSVVAPRLQDLAHRLSERYDTRVKVDLGKRKGRIVVEFASLDDLERIVDMMDPAKPPLAMQHLSD